MKTRKDKGITLIALVITIIVLLILAAVSIATLTGENGILTRANDAKTETEEAKEDELRRLTALEAATNLKNTTHTDNSTGKEKTVTIPAGFAVSQVEGENTIADGLVIIDSKGNEFVWVPVSQENFDTEFVRNDLGIQNIPDSDFINTELTNSMYYEPEPENTNGTTATTKTEVISMYESVKRNEGFYVGRYEAGTSSSDARTDTSGVKDSVVIKQGANVYNYIGWSNDDDMSVETGGAVQKSREFAEENGYTTVSSTLIYGVQWDTIMRWMKDEANLTGGKYVQDSTGMGWYSDNYTSENPNHITGKDLNGRKNKVKNIYDLAGNVYEWTMESYDTFYRVDRGGCCYSSSGSQSPVSYRSYNYPSCSDSAVGFRVTLYLL